MKIFKPIDAIVTDDPLEMYARDWKQPASLIKVSRTSFLL